MNAPQENLPLEIDCRTVKGRLDANEDFVLVDCRESDEYETVHIAGSMLLPMSELLTRVDELADKKDKSIVVHCHHGGRSLKVTHWLRQQGYPRVQSMAGGIDQWSQEIDPSLPRY
jgi:rhodanese-related sulfurtransferase